MTILYLGPRRESVWKVLQSTGDAITHTEDKLGDRPELLESADMIVSYGYRHIIRRDVVGRFQSKIVNLHISLLPWNRGADPNVWSFLEDTPKGVSIHYIDCGVDTGPILTQKEIEFTNSETLRTSYEKLSVSIESLFAEQWSAIRADKIPQQPQIGEGTYHRAKDLEPFRHLLAQGWDTPVAALIGCALTPAGRTVDAE